MGLVQAFWDYLVLTAPYLLFGLIASGVVREFISIDFVKKHLSGVGIKPILKASFLGVPLPLCSCSVIPTAVTLRKEGASVASTSAFLISTPESGVDSVAMTYGVMDLPMTIIRPLAAFLTATVAGLGQNLFNQEFTGGAEGEGPKSTTGSCCSKKKTPTITLWERSKRAMSFSFGKLNDDISLWLFIGLTVGAAMNYFLPEDLFTQIPGWGSRLLVLGFGIPFYICASASTPIAASMMMKGMSPGTALIFLLVGPATNFTNIAVLQKYIGKKGVMINVLAIALVSLTLSFLVDFLYDHYQWPLNFNISHVHQHDAHWFEGALAVFLFILLLKGIYNEKIKPYWEARKAKAHHCCS